MKLQERAMLVSLNVSKWGATRTDRKISQEVADTHKVKMGRAGHYRKHAIDLAAESYQGVISAASELRNFHYTMTLPWGQDGARILTTQAYEDYSSGIRTRRAAFENACKVFYADYPNLKAAAKRDLNGMYNEGDYPMVIASKFGVQVNIMPMPDSTDFRADLPNDVVDNIRKDIETQLQATTAEAMRDPYQRLYDHINRMVERLGDKKGIFRDTLVSGLEELCSILPGLNLTQDEKLEELRGKAERMIKGLDPEDLRKNKSVRRNVLSQAKSLKSTMDMMGAFMGKPSDEEAA